MTLVLGALVPHPPLLIPNIGKSNRDLLKATILAYQKIADKLVEKKVDTIFIISPHAVTNPEVFTINLSPALSSDFKDFGDFSTKKTWAVDIGLAYKIRESLETSAPLQMISSENLDHGSSVPLTLLTEKLPDVKIISFANSYLGLQAHFDLGNKIKKQIANSPQNVAVIASGDLSHRLTKDAPAGYSPKGKKFDKKLCELLIAKKTDEIIGLDENLIEEAGECGLRSFLILLGIIHEINYKPKLLSYEGPFGVGYLVMDFCL